MKGKPFFRPKIKIWTTGEKNVSTSRFINAEALFPPLIGFEKMKKAYLLLSEKLLFPLSKVLFFVSIDKSVSGRFWFESSCHFCTSD